MLVDKERLNDISYVERLKQELESFNLIGLSSKGESEVDKACLFVKSYIENERLLVDIIDISKSNKAIYKTIILGTSSNYKITYG